MNDTRRNVFLLAICQGFSMSGASMLLAVSGLAGLMIAPDKTLATLPMALQFAATMCATIPASLFMARVGRRWGFSIGQIMGILGGALSSYAVFTASFPLFMVGAFLLGIHNAFWQYYRFAAADVSTEDYRARAISYVMAGGLFAAFCGPQLAKYTETLWAVTFSASFAAIAVLSVVSLFTLQFIRIPKPPAVSLSGAGRPIVEIMRTPVFIVAVLSSTIGYGMMNMLMTSTPLAMQFCGFDFNSSATVIQWHIVGMFAPSFFTGSIIKRFGVVNVIAAGALLQALAIGIALSGIEFFNFSAGLIVLGLGWNFMFIGGTTLLTEAYSPEEKAKTQAAHDFIVFGTVAMTAFASGVLHEKLGWVAVNLIAAVPVAVAFLIAIWYGARTRKRLST